MPYKPEDVEALVDAVWQVLDDMRVHVCECSGGAKMQLRVAYEPFASEDLPTDTFVPLEKAREILAQL